MHLRKLTFKSCGVVGTFTEADTAKALTVMAADERGALSRVGWDFEEI
jgi:hypothetical protein